MSVIEGAKHRSVAKFVYDFAAQGGAVGNIVMQGEALPDDAVIWDGFVDVITVPTSGGGATIALTTGQTANDLITAAAIAGAPWSTAGLKAIVPVGTQATAIRTTAARAPTLVVGTAALTAGRIILFIEYYLSE